MRSVRPFVFPEQNLKNPMLDFSEIWYVYVKWHEKETDVFSFLEKIRIFEILAKKTNLGKKPKKHITGL